MNSKLCKKSILFILCMLFLCTLIPATNIKASTVKKQGYYITLIATKKTAANAASDFYLKKAVLSGNRLTTYGNYVYYTSNKVAEKSGDNYKEMKIGKRIFNLSKKVKFYADGALGKDKVSKISKNKASKALKKLNSDYYLAITVKNKKVTKIEIYER